jgi:hypothetical protein
MIEFSGAQVAASRLGGTFSSQRLTPSGAAISCFHER